MRPVESAEEMRLAAWRIWSEATDAERDAMVIAAARVQGWRGTLRTWRSNVSRWFSPDARHPLPAFMLLILGAHTGRGDEFTGLLFRSQAGYRKRPLRAGSRPRPRQVTAA